MNIGFDITHPADVHLFRHSIIELQKNGYQVQVTARNLPVIHQLLSNFKIEFISRKSPAGIWGRILGLFSITWQLYRIFRKFQPDILIAGPGNIYIPIIAHFLNRHSIIVADTEHTRIQNWIVSRLAKFIYTPQCYRTNIGKKQKRFNGTKELIYLDPFLKDHIKLTLPDIIAKSGTDHLKESFKPYKQTVLIRLSAWQATHDLFMDPPINWRNVVVQLSYDYNIIIIPAGSSNPALAPWIPNLSVEDYHPLIALSDIVITEGATTAAEGAILGKPVIYANPLRLGYLNELEKDYGLVFNVNNDYELFSCFENIGFQVHYQRRFREKRDRYIRDKGNTLKWLSEQLLNDISQLREYQSSQVDSITFIANIDPDIMRLGGIESYIREIATRMRKNDVPLHVVGVREQGMQASHHSHYADQMEYSSFEPIVNNNEKSFISSFRFLTNLLIRAWRVHFDKHTVLHFQRADFALPFIWRSQRKVCTIHGNPGDVIQMTKSRFHYIAYRLLERFVLPRMDSIIFVAESAIDIYRERFPKLTHKMALIPPLFSKKFMPLSVKSRKLLRTKFHLPTEAKICSYVGRFEMEKNVSELLRDMKLLIDENPNIHFLMVGRGSEEKNLRRLATEYHSHNIHIMTDVPYHEVAYIYNLSDITLLYSHSEGLPIAALESIACGVPVICRDAGDLRLLIQDGVNGWLMQNGNGKNLIRRALYENPISPQVCAETVSNGRDAKLFEAMLRTYGIAKRLSQSKNYQR
ncbi:glycosyltransferase [candidate division KSB1 bacterium]|nr:glycosyltransferase [candidate division KSB1 bacterium]